MLDRNDIENFKNTLGISEPSTSKDNNLLEMDAASMDLYPSETQEEDFNYYDKCYENQPLGSNIFAPQSAVSQDKNRTTYVRDTGTVTQTSSERSMLAFLADLSGFGNKGIVKEIPASGGLNIGGVFAHYASEGWNATVGRAVSYMNPSYNIVATSGMTRADECRNASIVRVASIIKPSPSNSKSNRKPQSHEVVAQGQMANPAVKPPQYPDDEIFAQSMFAVENLSIQEDKKRIVKPFVSFPVGNMESPFEAVDKTVVADANSCDVKYMSEEDVNKASDIDKNFDSVKKGIGEIMKRRKKDVYLHYISRLISVKDEHGNL